MDAISVTERRYVLTEKIDETPEVIILRLKPEGGSPTSFDPGMFMMISGIDGAGRRYTGKAFSIASDPSSPVMEFMVIKKPMHGDQIAKSHFVDSNIGDVFMLRGPNGQFRFDPKVESKVMFIAGGTGLAPFISMLRHIRSTGSKSDVVLFYSVKFPTEIIVKKELDSYVVEDGLKLVVTVTRPRPDDGWTGKTGHIDAEMIKSSLPDYADRTAYICGPLAFVKAVKGALAALGLPQEKIKADVWG